MDLICRGWSFIRRRVCEHAHIGVELHKEEVCVNAHIGVELHKEEVCVNMLI